MRPTEDTATAAVSVAACISHHISLGGKPLTINLRSVQELLQVCGERLYMQTEMDKIAAQAADERTVEVAGVLLCIALGSLQGVPTAAEALSTARMLLEGLDDQEDDISHFCELICSSTLSSKLTEATLDILRATYTSSSSPSPTSLSSLPFSLLTSPFPSTPGSYLGTGMSATIMHARLPDGQEVAIKQPSHSDVYLKEVALLSSLLHPNVIEICGLEMAEGRFCMPFQPGGTLRDLVYAGELTRVCYRTYIEDLFRGLAYVHSMGIMHGDLKMDNLLISSANTLKIADFGHAIGGMFSPKLLPNKYISPLHRPYELLIAGDDPDTRVHYGTEVDIWSCGIIILEMTDSEGMRARLRALGSVQAYIAELLEDKLESVTRRMAKDIALVTRQCLSIPSCRPTARQCLAGLVGAEV